MAGWNEDVSASFDGTLRSVCDASVDDGKVGKSTFHAELGRDGVASDGLLRGMRRQEMDGLWVDSFSFTDGGHLWLWPVIVRTVAWMIMQSLAIYEKVIYYWGIRF